MTNVDTAKVFFGVVLKQLQASFPAAYHITYLDIWPEFESLAKDGVLALKYNRRHRVLTVTEASENEELRKLYTKQMLLWMVDEDYIRPDPTSGYKLDYVLSSKSLAVLNLNLSDKEDTIGNTLKRLVSSAGDKATGEVISLLIGKAFAATQGMAQ
ncbi:hypothetical protein [Yoonia vestfoldensis]|uniref:hypothetical protein n=1 Tax=Yoonia vestfoldensis TaxID=245188 RepID=UPI00037852CA|nr:hypothetical protein [Yoonia vestfoldensis]